MKLSGRHRKTLGTIFEDPARSDVVWIDVEKLLGAEVSEGRGSRVRVYLNGVRAVHRPHPRKETDKGALRSVQRFLLEAGVGPGE
ncbi:MAG: type II toxin-antitoxin system HicA family toxin [Rubrobacter sp.]|jgi:hypothetical protein|nr:type II toxin-antitoxin system HicA family toxin [Rubrobacter sp.]